MLFSSLSTVIRRRHTSRVVACAIVLSLSPVMLFGGSAAAEVAGVTGLAQGSQGDAVRAVQQALVNQGIAVAGGVDGVFGSATVSALKQFQTRNGLNATGVVDDATALALGLTTSPLLGLTQGAQGEAVRQLQQRLIDIGIPVTGGADGVFGRRHDRRGEGVPGRKGYSKTGVVNAATAVALGAATTAATPAAPAPAPAPTPATNPSSMSGLKIGARGDAVKQLQQQLIAAGFPMVGGADGVFGALTANALGSFQQSNGLPVDTRRRRRHAGGTRPERPPTAAAAAPECLLSPARSQGRRSGRCREAAAADVDQRRCGGEGRRRRHLRLEHAGRVEAVPEGGRSRPQSGEVDEATASALASGKSIAGGPSGLVGLKSGSLGSTGEGAAGGTDQGRGQRHAAAPTGSSVRRRRRR